MEIEKKIESIKSFLGALGYEPEAIVAGFVWSKVEAFLKARGEGVAA